MLITIKTLFVSILGTIIGAFLIKKFSQARAQHLRNSADSIDWKIDFYNQIASDRSELFQYFLRCIGISGALLSLAACFAVSSLLATNDSFLQQYLLLLSACVFASICLSMLSFYRDMNIIKNLPIVLAKLDSKKKLLDDKLHAIS